MGEPFRLEPLGAPSLGDLDPFVPRYNSDADFAVPKRPEATTLFLRLSYNEVFSAEERKILDPLIEAFTKARQEQGLDSPAAQDLARQLQAYQNTAERAAALSDKLAGFDTQRATQWFNAKTLTPRQASSTLNTLCRDQVIDNAYDLKMMGCRAEPFGYAGPNRLHAFTAFSCGGGWNAINSGLVQRVEGSDSRDVVRRYLPEAYKLWGFSPLRSEDDVPLLGAYSLETPVGLELRRTMHGTDGRDFSLSGLGERDKGVSLGFDNEGVTLTAKSGDFSGRVRGFGPLVAQSTGLPANGPLAGSFAMAVGYSRGPGLRLSAGFLGLYNMSVGYSFLNSAPEEGVPDGYSGRVQKKYPATVPFVAVASEKNLWNVRPHETVNIRGDVGTRAAVAVGLLHAHSDENEAYGSGIIDPGATPGLSHWNNTWRNLVSWTPDAKFQLWGSATAYLPVDDMLLFGLAGGYKSEVDRLGETPVSAFAEAGFALQLGEEWSLAPRYYEPIRTRTNLYAAERRWMLPVTRHTGRNFGVAVSASGGESQVLDRASLGLRMGPFTLSAGIRHLGDQKQGWGGLELNLDEILQGR